ncbi:NADPH-dependent ferric siderophore reductase, contains FAD-binding and SIP domains [Nocardioides sp. YR527]|uniref:siderophore-interacting protein n=1 Tax=Nocardioides sp. YR527 TaxID=1881028 RepID=UPI000884C843|nr:siderophore-interacting protein [Nocardioides sp. YR527]SDK30500.1 NADPH-dependent ferric siderophore reductase, contains FAD-binding and SIP domains [Nocardioides sp. YR527]
MPILARVSVRSVERLSPSFARIELAGDDLADFGNDGPSLDQRIKLLFPAVPGVLPELSGENWYAEWLALPEDERPRMRTYTIRSVEGEGIEKRLYVDFVLHPGAHGPGSDWAGAAEPGDEILVAGPKLGEPYGGIEWLPGDATRLLLVGDETAVPAIVSILESLPADATGSAFLEVPAADDVQDVVAPEGLEVSWLPREGAPVGGPALAAVGGLLGFEATPEDVTSVEVEDPDLWETPDYSSSGEEVSAPANGSTNGSTTGEDGRYAWIAGESRMVTALRRHLVNELEMPRKQVAFMGYWREGVSMKG